MAGQQSLFYLPEELQGVLSLEIIEFSAARWGEGVGIRERMEEEEERGGGEGKGPLEPGLR